MENCVCAQYVNLCLLLLIYIITKHIYVNRVLVSFFYISLCAVLLHIVTNFWKTFLSIYPISKSKISVSTTYIYINIYFGCNIVRIQKKKKEKRMKMLSMILKRCWQLDYGFFCFCLDIIYKRLQNVVGIQKK